MIKPILLHDNPMLRQPLDPVPNRIMARAVGEELRAHLIHYRGLGLAANQIGLPYKAFIMDAGKSGTVVFINPRITSVKGVRKMEEGCLSVPNLTAEVARGERVGVIYRNERYELVERVFHGLEATVIQHEADHLKGITILDHMED